MYCSLKLVGRIACGKDAGLHGRYFVRVLGENFSHLEIGCFCRRVCGKGWYCKRSSQWIMFVSITNSVVGALYVAQEGDEEYKLLEVGGSLVPKQEIKVADADT